MRQIPTLSGQGRIRGDVRTPKNWRKGVGTERVHAPTAGYRIIRQVLSTNCRSFTWILLKEVFTMPKAYVLINVKSQHRVKETLVALQRKKGVVSADAIFGPYDIIAVIEGQDLEDLSSTVIDDLYDLGHIENSTTCIAI